MRSADLLLGCACWALRPVWGVGGGGEQTYNDPRLKTNASCMRFLLDSDSFQSSGSGKNRMIKCSMIPRYAPESPIRLRSRHLPGVRMSQIAWIGIQRTMTRRKKTVSWTIIRETKTITVRLNQGVGNTRIYSARVETLMNSWSMI